MFDARKHLHGLIELLHADDTAVTVDRHASTAIRSRLVWFDHIRDGRESITVGETP